MKNASVPKKLPAKLRIERLDRADQARVDACISLLEQAFDNPVNYSPSRLRCELGPQDAAFYREFFVATIDGEVVGFGGVKAADWASHTHLLYLSAVAAGQRGQGIARAILQARLSWLELNFPCGRILVSSRREKRFLETGFSKVGKDDIAGRHLFMRDIQRKTRP